MAVASVIVGELGCSTVTSSSIPKTREPRSPPSDGVDCALFWVVSVGVSVTRDASRTIPQLVRNKTKSTVQRSGVYRLKMDEMDIAIR